MATKQLSRTIIEGGRTTNDKDARHEANRTARHKIREELGLLVKHIDEYDDSPDIKSEKPTGVFRDEKHADKTNPVKRFLESRVGKSWNKTYRLIKEKFDTSTTAGKHVVYDHILNSVGKYSDDHHKYRDFIVDKNGILRQNKTKGYVYPNFVDRFNYAAVSCWLEGRMVRNIDGLLRWFAPVKEPGASYHTKFSNRGWLEYFRHSKLTVSNNTYHHNSYIEYNAGYDSIYRDAGRLNDTEAKYFFNLPIEVQREILQKGGPKKSV